MDGILNINKPPGKTSFYAVARVKKLTGEKRVGHAGTLDPTATGVLPVCLGKATRVVEYLMHSTKTYLAQIELGKTTDTYDASGKITQHHDPSAVNKKQLESALDSFRGAIQQTPPMFSALKRHGRPLYELARAGIEVPRQSRPVHINRLEMTAWQPPLVTLEVECSKGTYIRSLAHDLGQQLGCGASLKDLTRLSYGIFKIGDAISLEQLENAVHDNSWLGLVYPADSVLQNLPAIIVSNDTEVALKNGQTVTLPESPDDGKEEISPRYCRAYNLTGLFIGILRYLPEEKMWHPDKVFN
ncbi:tRNA pseudouridine(55) synthase TruB [Chloroflexota bacterium]